MGFKRCEDLQDVYSKLYSYEHIMTRYSCSGLSDPYSSAACSVVELMDMVKVLAKEVESLKDELSKTLGGV